MNLALVRPVAVTLDGARQCLIHAIIYLLSLLVSDWRRLLVLDLPLKDAFFNVVDLRRKDAFFNVGLLLLLLMIRRQSISGHLLPLKPLVPQTNKQTNKTTFACRQKLFACRQNNFCLQAKLFAYRQNRLVPAGKSCLPAHKNQFCGQSDFRLQAKLFFCMQAKVVCLQTKPLLPAGNFCLQAKAVCLQAKLLLPAGERCSGN